MSGESKMSKQKCHNFLLSDSVYYKDKNVHEMFFQDQLEKFIHPLTKLKN